ncbi:hypothetical protein KSP39_PZI021185 [Platanthera zijinensis]|uniref:Heme O synthase n=1 Tax=Platanthera zijinensis TaxID=2320716 RepID=A0AAP0AXD3_9ASPA
MPTPRSPLGGDSFELSRLPSPCPEPSRPPYSSHIWPASPPPCSVQPPPSSLKQPSSSSLLPHHHLPPLPIRSPPFLSPKSSRRPAPFPPPSALPSVRHPQNSQSDCFPPKSSSDLDFFSQIQPPCLFPFATITPIPMLVVATSGAGYVLGSGHVIDFAGLCCTCAGTMMVAASANSLNQVFEVQNDSKMKRTRQRPLPSGRITVPHAVIWASSMGIAGTALLACKANYLASGLAASNLFLYAFVYTPLKQIHPANTWIGAVVGAIPPLLGWAAATGGISLNAMLLPAALYFWQIPHFMALAYLCRNDYVVGGFRMISFADTSGWRTAWISLRNCLYLLPVGFLSYDWGVTSKWFAVESSAITLFLGAAALLFVRDRTVKSARRMFHASLLYLPVFMSGMLLHRLPWNKDVQAIPAEAEAEECEHESGRILPIRSPVAYASAAPFPFLPVPIYAPTGL